MSDGVVQVPGVQPAEGSVPGLSRVEEASLSPEMVDLCQRCAQAGADMANEKAGDRFGQVMIAIASALGPEGREVVYSSLAEGYSEVASQALRDAVDGESEEQG